MKDILATCIHALMDSSSKPDPSQIPVTARLGAVDRALALPNRTKAAVTAAVGEDMMYHCPHVCEMLWSKGDADLMRLREWMRTAWSIQTGETDKDQAEKDVGEELADVYVRPVVQSDP